MASTTRVCIGSCRGSTSSINPSARWGDIMKPLLPSPAWARSASRGDLSRKRERGPFCPVGDIMKPLLPSPASGRGDRSGGRGLLQEVFAEAACGDEDAEASHHYQIGETD